MSHPEEAFGPGCDWIAFSAQKARLARSGRLTCRVVSDSMQPLIPVGTPVEIEPVSDSRELRRFDLLVFFQGERLNCHYLWHRNQAEGLPALCTRSLKDPLRDDPPLVEGQVLGRVVGVRVPWRTRAWVILRNLARGTA